MDGIGMSDVVKMSGGGGGGVAVLANPGEASNMAVSDPDLPRGALRAVRRDLAMGPSLTPVNAKKWSRRITGNGAETTHAPDIQSTAICRHNIRV
jgi:hypothetical protein